MKLKLCGLSRPEDIRAANACLPDYVGFVFTKSIRQVGVGQAAALQAALDPTIQAVGVFVGETAYTIADTVYRTGLDVVQLHGDEPESLIRELKDILPQIQVWRALRLKNLETLYRGVQSPADMLLFDAFTKEAPGGTGKAADWPMLAANRPERPFFLAGGLHAGNLEQAIHLVRPHGLDLSSGVETNGVKDPDKMRAVTELVRSLPEGGAI